jgi:predicted N-formylglutamate amidohydrolase
MTDINMNDGVSGHRGDPIKHQSILQPDEPGSVRQMQGADPNWFIVCDHASNRVPRALDSLGLRAEELALHIAWDIGAALVAERLASRLRAPLVETGYSRLIIDCNRYPHASDSIPPVSDHRWIEANKEIDREARRQRQIEFFQPYHRTIHSALLEADREGHNPAFLSIHSCAPSMDGRHRPWHIGVGWSRDQRMSAPVLKQLAGLNHVIVGNNEPYKLEVGEDFTTPEHAMRRGLAHLQIEFRQDLVSTQDQATKWADLLYDAMMAVESKESWFRREDHLTPADHIHGIEKWL